MLHIVSKNFIKLGRRILLEVLYVPQRHKAEVDLIFSLSIGYRHGLSLSMYCPKFLLEFALFPIESCTHYDYLYNTKKEKIS